MRCVFCADGITSWRFPTDDVLAVSVGRDAGNPTSAVRVHHLQQNAEFTAQPATPRSDHSPRPLPVSLPDLQQGPASGARPPRPPRQPARLEEGIPMFDLRPRVRLQAQPEAPRYVASRKDIAG